MRVRVAMRSSPSGPFTVTLSLSMVTARVFSRISMPFFSSLALVYARSLGSNGPSTAPIPSTRRILASVVSTER